MKKFNDLKIKSKFINVSVDLNEVSKCKLALAHYNDFIEDFEFNDLKIKSKFINVSVDLSLLKMFQINL